MEVVCKTDASLIKAKVIAIENQNSWTDGGVASPTPFYWSTNGYGMMWYTFKRRVRLWSNRKKQSETISQFFLP